MPFDDPLGDDGMDDMERHFSDLTFWEPMNRTNHDTEQIDISKGTIEQVTSKKMNY